jgi:hypothetical protein
MGGAHGPTEPRDLPLVAAGDPCPACGGTIVVDGVRRYTGVPIYPDGTNTDEATDGDFEFEGNPYCSGCRQPVRVEW